MSDDERRERARERVSRMTLRKGRLDREPADPDVVRGEAALSLVATLSRESWSLARLPMPSYGRAEVPCRFIRDPNGRGSRS